MDRFILEVNNNSLFLVSTFSNASNDTLQDAFRLHRFALESFMSIHYSHKTTQIVQYVVAQLLALLKTRHHSSL
jgi:hypothetical protein